MKNYVYSDDGKPLENELSEQELEQALALPQEQAQAQAQAQAQVKTANRSEVKTFKRSDVKLFTTESIQANKIVYVVSMVSGVGVAFCWIRPKRSLELARARAEISLREAAQELNANAVIAINIANSSTVFGLPSFSRQSITLIGTAVSIKD
jgi:uncharacterized protein YbjQ (UPF0145 family)